MDNITYNIKNNKNIIIFCVCLIVFFVVIVLIFNNREKFNKDTIVRVERIKKYDSNQYIPVYVTTSDMANKYLNEYKNVILSNLNDAYNLLNKDYRENKFKDFDHFSEYINDLISISFYNMTVKEYNVYTQNGNKFYYIKTSNGDTYIFKELSIMNYEVYLDDYTVELN